MAVVSSRGWRNPPAGMMRYLYPEPSVPISNPRNPASPDAASNNVALPASPSNGTNARSNGFNVRAMVSPVVTSAREATPDAIIECATDSAYTYWLHPRLISNAAQLLLRP